MAISFGIFGVLRASEIPLDLIRLHVYGVLGSQLRSIVVLISRPNSNIVNHLRKDFASSYEHNQNI